MSATASLIATYVKLTALPILLAGSDEQKDVACCPASLPESAWARTRSPSPRRDRTRRP